MKAKFKIVLGLTIAVGFLGIASQSLHREGNFQSNRGGKTPCYGSTEIRLLKDAHGWSEQQVVRILDLACEYSKAKK